MLELRTYVGFCWLCVTPLFAQMDFARAGYTLPEPLEVAPGQIVMISTRGVTGRTPTSVFVSKPETELDGIRVSITQKKSVPIYVNILGLDQRGCTPDQIGCDPLTSLTIALPFELSPDADSPALVINDRGRDLSPIPLRPVLDRIHILNSCDMVAVFVGVFSQLQEQCSPVITHANGSPVTRQNPAHPGEVLVAWAYGLGVPGGSAVAGGISWRVAQNPPELHFQYRPNAAGMRVIQQPGTRPVFTGLMAPWGLYQTNFAIPELPAGLALSACDGVEIRSNLTITFSGANSQDSARICVTTGPDSI